MFSFIKNPRVPGIAFTGILLMILPCCEKQAAAADDKMTILTTGTWRLTSYISYTITGIVDVYASYSDCRKDDLLSFNKDGTAEINEGPSKCDASDPQSQFIQWRFLNDQGSRIEINGAEFIVDKLEDNEFRISTSRTDPYSNQDVIIYNR